jgi:hypothetical protein
MTITITSTTIALVGPILFIFSILAFFGGDLPDHEGRRVWNVIRCIAWPLMLLWLCFFLIKGIFF